MLACAGAALANPVGPQVAAGSATFNTAGKTLTVTNTPGAILNWQFFSIGAGELTRFQQQSALSAVLNRVTGGDPSAIFGTLSSNGRVFLINTHGIVFGQGAVINTAGFVASTLNMRNEDFLAGRMKFEGGGDGVLSNAGTIRASGDIFLVGPQIENTGIIRSDNGTVVLAAGRSLTITSPDAQGVQFALQAPTDAVINLGAIEAGNAAALFAGTLKHSGDIRATSASIDAAGRVILAAQKDAIVDGNATIHADNTAGKGGSVQITGERVGLFDQATVSARGATGGGEILVGGDVQGANPNVRNAAMTHVAAGAALDASATAAGNGGKVIVWADDTARVYGSVMARGGARGGAGGFIETSGKRHLDVGDIRVDAVGGTWLLDPLNIEVVAGNGLVNNGGATTFTPGGGSSQIGADLITAQLNAGTSVTLNTNVAGGDAGNILISSPIIKAADNAASLTLTANNDITVNQNISLSTNNLATSTTSGANANFIATAGGVFSINNATVEAFHISVDAASISRSGAQANDFVFGFVFPTAGTLTLTTQSGAVGSLANPIRFANPDFAGRTWGVNTVNAGAAGNIFIQPTKTDYGTFGGAAIQTDPATTQTVYLNHTGTGTFNLFGNITGNDDWTLNSAGSFSANNFGGGGNGGKLTANSISSTIAGNFGGTSAPPGNPGTVFDTSAANGNITMTGQTFSGTGCGGDNFGFGIAPGTGTVTATSIPGAACGGAGSIQLAHFGGDLLTSRYALNFTGGGAGDYMRLKAGDGHLVVDSTAGFNASLNNKETLLQTLTAGKDIIFQGGTVQGGRVEVRATGNIDNLAPGTNGFIQTNAFGGPHWMLVAGGGIGLSNPVEGQANWVGSAASGAPGAAGDINIKFTGGSPRFGEIRTAPGSVQSINLQSTAGLIFSLAQPGYGGVLGGGSSSVTANDNYTINAAGSIFFDNFDNSFTASTITMTSGGGIVHGVSGGGDMMSTTGLLTMNANGGSIGASGNPARLRGSGTKTLFARDDLYIHTGSNPLTLTGLTTGAGAGTINLTTTAANDLTLGGTTNIDDALVLNIGGNIIFPAAADFTTSGGLTLNSPTQIASTATVTVLGGVLGGSGAVTNAGALDKAGAGVGDFSGGFSNTGTVNVNGGTLGFSGGYTDGGGVLVLGGGTVTAPAAGLVFNTGQLSGVGTISGNLTSNNTLNIGLSPGTMSVTGNLTLGVASTLNVELGGTTQGVNYDLLQVTGNATLDGTLNATLFGGFTGAAGNVFDVITYASRTGDFATVNFPAGLTMTATPNSTFYQLAISAPPPPPPPPPPPMTTTSPATSSDATVLLAANDARVLLDRFVSVFDPGKKTEEEEKKGAVLECR
ncbi:MAG: beta strand repeat-containing protein [Burkholderiales bacterium]